MSLLARNRRQIFYHLKKARNWYGFDLNVSILLSHHFFLVTFSNILLCCHFNFASRSVLFSPFFCKLDIIFFSIREREISVVSGSERAVYKWNIHGFIHLVRTQKIFRKTKIPDPLIRTRTCAYYGVRNVSFSENFAYALNGWSPI